MMPMTPSGTRILPDLDATRTDLELADLADRIRQGGDLIDAFGHRRHAAGRECQAIEQGRLEAGGARGGDIFLIGGEQRVALPPDRRGDGAQRAVLGLAVGARHQARGLAGVATDGLHVLFDVHEACPVRRKADYSHRRWTRVNGTSGK
jgi:hypothetical protein